MNAQELAKFERLLVAERNHEATDHVIAMLKILKDLGDLTDQDFYNRSITVALLYLLKRVREEDIA